ncbi:MAG: DUF177 domain-containing protein [Alphaproteobacteria bacterium]|nr:DUF177 domain-containing protein [Alphaproteobacteria bacterium]
MTEEITVELRRLINLDRISRSDKPYSIKTTEGEREALAQRFGLVAIHTLSASYTISPSSNSRKGYMVLGSLSAKVVQSCIRTLVDVPEKIDIKFSILVVDQKHETLNPFDPEHDEDYEYSAEGEIDLGEVTAQYLSLNLNPFPQKTSSELSKSSVENAPTQTKKNPFAVLETLKSS